MLPSLARPVLIVARYSTRTELILDAIGLVAAAGAGAAQVRPFTVRPPIHSLLPNQPLMSLIFGNLVETFVTFGSAENTYFQDTSNATAIQELNAAAAQFRHDAGQDALYLVCIGTAPRLLPHLSLIPFQELPCSSAPMFTWSSGYTQAK